MSNNSKINETILSYLMNYNPEMIGLFGSYARNENKMNSDIDILVKFKEIVSLLQLVKIENELSHLLGVKVDLLTTGALKNERVKLSIEKDLQIIYQA